MLDKSYDKELTALPLKRWLPWVGDNYHQKRVLIIGESHYKDKDYNGWLDGEDGTRIFVTNQGLNSNNPDFKKRQFFLMVEKTLLNKDTSTFEEREKLWNNVAYCNLVQRLLPSIEDRPNEGDNNAGWTNFLDMIDILKPQICIKYGQEGKVRGRLGDILNTSNKGWLRDDIAEFSSESNHCINITKENHKVRIIYIPHPSTERWGYDIEGAHEHIKDKFPSVDTLFK